MLDELRTQHREIARLKFEGMTPVDIAKQTNMALGTVYCILSDPLCKAAIDKLNDEADRNIVDVRRKLVAMNAKALETLEACMDQTISPSVQLAAAKDVLDRNGYVPHIKVDHMHLHLTKEELDGIKERARMTMNFPSEDDIPVISEAVIDPPE